MLVPILEPDARADVGIMHHFRHAFCAQQPAVDSTGDYCLHQRSIQTGSSIRESYKVSEYASVRAARALVQGDVSTCSCVGCDRVEGSKPDTTRRRAKDLC
jgi:hypothetical protein